MGAPWRKSKNRGDDCEQSEFCAFCGQLVDASTLIEADVQGLRGQMICRTHPWEAMARLAPSFQDLGGIGQAPQPTKDEYPHGAPDWLATNPKYMLSLDGSAGYVAVNGTAPAGSMALEVLAQPTIAPGASAALVAFRNGTSAGLRLLYLNLIYPTFAVRNDAGGVFEVSASTPAALGRREFYSGVLDTAAGFIYIYVNGARRGALAVTGTFATALSGWAVGRLPDNAMLFFGGYVAEARVWSTVRTPQDILRYAFSSLTGAESGLSQLLPFNDGAGTGVANLAPGGSTGSVVGTPAWVSR